MANKLKNIFSNNPPEYKSTVKFRSNDAYRNFRAALDVVERDGAIVPVDGIESVSMFMEDHGIRIPIKHSDGITEFMVGPAMESAPFTVAWGDYEKTYKFRRYRISDGIVLETEKNAVVYLKLVFSEDAQKVKITYQIQYEFAKTIEEIDFELNACISFLSNFYAPTAEMGTTEDLSTMKEVLRCLRYTEGFMSRLTAVEKELGMTFLPNELNTLSSEDQQDVEELYLLLCRKIPLRANAKITSTEANKIEISKERDEIKIGTKIALCFTRKIEFELLGQQFVIYTANALINAIIKDFQQNGEQVSVFYGDTDSQPMYIAYSAFLQEEQAKKETERNIGGEKAYAEARTAIQYMKEYFDAVE